MNDIGTPTSFKQLIQSMTTQDISVVEGHVTSALPLKITLANDAKMVLTTNSIIVPRHLTDYTAGVDIVLQDGTVTSANMVIHNSLQAGDVVELLSFNNGKRFYILDRKG